MCEADTTVCVRVVFACEKFGCVCVLEIQLCLSIRGTVVCVRERYSCVFERGRDRVEFVYKRYNCVCVRERDTVVFVCERFI